MKTMVSTFCTTASADSNLQIVEYNAIEGASTLEINSVEYENSGNYSCTSGVRILFEFEVIVNPPSPEILQGLIWITENDQPVTFTCHSWGRKSILIMEWVEEKGQEMTPYSNASFQQYSEIKFRNDLKIYEASSTLTFTASPELDRYNFTCLVKNEDDSTIQTTSIQLIITSDSRGTATYAIFGTLGAVTIFAVAAVYWAHLRRISVNTQTPPTAATKQSSPTNQNANENESTQSVCGSEMDYMETHSHIWENFE